MSSPPGDNAVQSQTVQTVSNSANSSSATVVTFSKTNTNGEGGGGSNAGDSFVLPFPMGLEITTNYDWGSEDTGTLAQDMKANGGKWGNLSMETAKKAWDGFKANVSQDAADLIVENLGKASFAGEGLVLNPKKEVMFNGVSHRTFELQWQFAPLNQKESNASYEFIKAIHIAAAPQVTEDTTFLTYPETVTIVVQDAGQAILTRNECAITALSCNFTPDGFWAAFTNGKPVHLNLSASFMELQLPTKENAASIFGA